MTDPYRLSFGIPIPEAYPDDTAIEQIISRLTAIEASAVLLAKSARELLAFARGLQGQ